MTKLNPWVAVVIGGVTAAVSTAIPLVDDGLLPSETLAIVLAGLVGTGLTAAPVSVGRAARRADD